MRQLGVFMGRDLDPNHESRHFIGLNDWILSKYGGSWDRPPSLSEIQDSSATRRKIIRRLAAASSGLQMIRYWGLNRYSQFKRQRFLEPWGWKDPRNTFTAWLWDEVFSDASYIYIVRCGIDVAQSLVNREGWIHRDYLFVERIQNLKRMLFDLLTLKRSISDFSPHLNKSRLKAALNIGNIESAFGLWETYSEASLKFLQNKADKNRQLQLYYEKLLEQPSQYIKMLADFCGLRISAEKEENIISKIDASRRFPFVKKPHLLEFYNTIRQSPFMRHYHYDNIL
jgi:hypothetical protein